MTRRAIVLAAFVGVLLPVRAQAQAEPAPAPTAVEPPSGSNFYLRLSAGLGWYRSNYGEGSYSQDAPARGLGIGFDALVGGMVNPRFAFGGALVTTIGPSLQLRQPAISCCPAEDGREVGGVSTATMLLGVFVDGLISPTSGWHVGGMLGGGRIRITVNHELPRSDFGPGGAVWLGHDSALGDRWSLGGLLRVDAAAGLLKFADDPDHRSGYQISYAGDPVSLSTQLMLTTRYR